MTNVVGRDHEAEHRGVGVVEVGEEGRELDDAAAHSLVVPEEKEGAWLVSTVFPGPSKKQLTACREEQEQAQS